MDDYNQTPLNQHQTALEENQPAVRQGSDATQLTAPTSAVEGLVCLSGADDNDAALERISGGFDDDTCSEHIRGSAAFEASAVGDSRPAVKPGQPAAVTSEYLYETEKVQEAHAAATAERSMMPRLSPSEREVSLYAEDEFNGETDYRLVDRAAVQKLERKLMPHREYVQRVHNQSVGGGGKLSQLLLDVVNGLTTRLAQSFSNVANIDGGAAATEYSYAFEDGQNADTQQQQPGASTRTTDKQLPQAVESDYVLAGVGDQTVTSQRQEFHQSASNRDSSHPTTVKAALASLNDAIMASKAIMAKATKLQHRMQAAKSDNAFLNDHQENQAGITLHDDTTAASAIPQTQHRAQAVDSDYAFLNNHQNNQTNVAPANQPLQNEHIEASPRGTTPGKQSPSAYMFKTTNDADLMAIVEQVTQQMNATIKEDADVDSQYVLTRRYGGKI